MVDMFLKPALRAAILTPAGSKKFALLGTLYKDERSKTVRPHFDVLERFFLQHIIKWEDLVPFEKDELDEHQQTKDQDGYSVLFKATLEHNIQVLSKIYLNISFANMGRMLGIDADAAEAIISAMASEGRIKARLNQLDDTVDFLVQLDEENVELFGAGDNEEDAAPQREPDRAKLSDVMLHDANSRIANACASIDKLTKDILKEFPHFSKYDQHVIQ